jgi:hypothetical protein
MRRRRRQMLPDDSDQIRSPRELAARGTTHHDLVAISVLTHDLDAHLAPRVQPERRSLTSSVKLLAAQAAASSGVSC